MPYARSTLVDVLEALKHNQSMLVSLCVSINHKCQSFYLDNGVFGLPVPSLKQLFSTAIIQKKFDKGIISSWEGYDDNNVSDLFLIPIVCIQIHLLQLVHLKSNTNVALTHIRRIA